MTVSIQRDGDIAHVIIDNPPVNAISQAVRTQLWEAVAALDADPDIAAVVLRCAGRTFVAGADIREFGKPPVPPHLPDLILAIENAAKPWIAAIHGTALGGGLELAMACRARIATPTATFGLPEVTLGLIPGAGGTVRLPRLVDAKQALDLVAGGRPIKAEQASKAGLIDAIVESGLPAEAVRLARTASGLPRTLARPVRQPDDAPAFQALAARYRNRARGQHSVGEAVAAIERALSDPADAALAAERAAFLKLKASEQSAALRHIFFAERSTLADPRCKGEPRTVDAVGVIGGGTMGAGIAATCLLRGLPVTLIERDAASAQTGRDRVEKVLGGSLDRGILTLDSHAEAVQGLRTDTDYAGLGEVDLVIEAVFENMDLKKQIFARLDDVTRPDAILATNTSYLDVNEIAATLRDPSRALGLHFFSPAHVMKLLEIVLPDAVADDVVATAARLSKRLGKIGVLAGVCDGFVGNRIMSAYRREADCLVEDGASPSEVDAAMRAFGFAMGIFEVQDMAGLDIAWAMRRRRAATRDPSERYVAIADRLCEAGRLGRKTGAGWYDYDNAGKAVPSDTVARIIAEERGKKSLRPQPLSGDEIMARILGAMQAEGRAVLADGIALHADHVDVVMVDGYGFPRWRGGPMAMTTG